MREALRINGMVVEPCSARVVTARGLVEVVMTAKRGGQCLAFSTLDAELARLVCQSLNAMTEGSYRVAVVAAFAIELLEGHETAGTGETVAMSKWPHDRVVA